MPSLSATLPSLKTGDTVAGAYSIKEGHTEPPKRYTDKTLVAAMAAAGKNLKDAELRKILADGKDGGIGTGATRAAIVEALVGHGYITRQKKQFYVTDAGIQLIQVLPIEDIKSPEITAVWEKRLKAIELGNEPYESFIRDIEAATRNWCRTIQNSTGTIQGTGENSGARESVGTCPICGKPLYPSKVGISCSGWRDGCKFKLWRTVCGKTLTDNQLKTLASGKQTALIKGFKKKNGSGTFDAKLYINEEYKIKFKFENRDVG
jgi:DNA topoisomerase-3